MLHIVIALLIGAVSGWIANIIMGNKTGLIRNIVVGIIGGFVGGYVFGLLDISFAGYLGTIIVSVAGACILIFLIDRFIK